MPQLPSLSTKIKRFVLPSTSTLPEVDQAWIDLDISNLKTRDILLIRSMEEHALVLQADILAGRIKDWNYTEADGSTVIINIDSVSRLDTEDFGFLVKTLNGELDGVVNDEQKKTLQSV